MVPGTPKWKNVAVSQTYEVNVSVMQYPWLFSFISYIYLVMLGCEVVYPDLGSPSQANRPTTCGQLPNSPSSSIRSNEMGEDLEMQQMQNASQYYETHQNWDKHHFANPPKMAFDSFLGQTQGTRVLTATTLQTPDRLVEGGPSVTAEAIPS